MGTTISRAEFQKQYMLTQQGLFVFEKEKHVPKALVKLNIGQSLSEVLVNCDENELSEKTSELIQKIVEPYTEVALSHIEILFSPSLNLNPVAIMLALCRNRKLCFCWPGRIQGDRLVYEEPTSPEYYEINFRGLIDTYIIIGGI